MALYGEFLLDPASHGPESKRHAREEFRDHPWFERTVKFCDRWDVPSDDPTYDTLTLDVFEPMARRIFSRTPYAHEDGNV